jgi:hypothetical protein
MKSLDEEADPRRCGGGGRRRRGRPAAKHATTTVPIVIGFVADPVGSGIVASLARPGGNITGWTHSGRELRAKYLELFVLIVPWPRRAARGAAPCRKTSPRPESPQKAHVRLYGPFA